MGLRRRRLSSQSSSELLLESSGNAVLKKLPKLHYAKRKRPEKLIIKAVQVKNVLLLKFSSNNSIYRLSFCLVLRIVSLHFTMLCRLLSFSVVSLEINSLLRQQMGWSSRSACFGPQIIKEQLWYFSILLVSKICRQRTSSFSIQSSSRPFKRIQNWCSKRFVTA